MMHKYAVAFLPRTEQMGRCIQWTPIRSRELAYVLGALIGDGHVAGRKENGNQFRILLQVTDRVFAEKFLSALRPVGLNPYKLRKASPRRNARAAQMWVAWSSSRMFSDWYRALTIEGIESWVAGHEDGFLAGLYEAEGHLIRYAADDFDISIGMTRQDVIHLVARIMHKWGFHPKTYGPLRDRRPRHKPIYRVCLFRKREVDEFFDRTKPCIKVAHHGNPEPSRNGGSGRV